LAVLLYAEDADVPGAMVTAGIDAAGGVDVQPSEIAGQVEVLEAARDVLDHGDRARVGQAAVVETGAGEEVGDASGVWRGGPGLAKAPEDRAGQRADAPNSARGRRESPRNCSARRDRRWHPSAARWHRPAALLRA